MKNMIMRAVATLPLLLGTALAQQNLAQAPMAGKTVPQWTQALPRLKVGAATSGIDVVTDTSIALNMCEFKVQILPAPSLPSSVWGYVNGPCPPQTTVRDTYLGPVVVATRDVPTSITFTNNLGSASTTNVLAYKYSVDQTLHWADPAGLKTGMPGMNYCAMNAPPAGSGPASGTECASTYTGSIPAVPHLHGGVVPPELDGGPEAWFTSDGSAHGGGYYTSAAISTNQVTYNYPNAQEAAPIWFHDHTLGATRLNVYAGLAGAYLVTDPNLGLPSSLPGVADVIPVVLQDRMFDTNGQLFFPSGTVGNVLYALNPEHPYWVPEFLGDVVVVNGKAWPFVDVEPKRYRFLFLNGSNARTYDLSLGVPMYVIGNDGGYLDSAVAVPNLVIMPGERYELIIDFTGLKAGRSVILTNKAPAPYPAGAPPSDGMGQILKFNVIPCVAGGCGAFDNTFNPAATPQIRTPTMVHLVQAGAPAVAPNVKRMLTLNEVMGMPPKGVTDPVTGLATNYPGGPLEILVNNTKWSGESTRTYNDFTTIATVPMPTKVSELPREGDVELWEIVNLTADAHPIHLHLVQFQVLNRQTFDLKGYSATYAAAFPAIAPCAGGVYCPGFGPPLDYNAPNASGYVGGNPDVAPFLKKNGIALPAGQETGWKDTVMAPPGMVTRFVVRWAPPSTPLGSTGTYPFDPSGRDGVDGERGMPRYGYVWHCHIIDHEDNEMMRADYVNPLNVTRTYLKGVDY